ncbi:MAG: BACON domain-containing protein, partial [Bacteroidales bacterium]|nr:BACON domain-containing protein [Bacteroidales bacterium]
FSIAANPNLESRVGTITISSEDISQTVKVTQLGNENYNLIVIRHTNSEFAVPAIEGNNIVGIVEWGDGTVEKYIPNMKHTYQQSKEYKMLIKLVGATVCEIPDMIGIEEVDFSKF